MATEKQQTYGNDSISALKGADRVRKRPGVIFGSDGLEGCEHAVFEILSLIHSGGTERGPRLDRIWAGGNPAHSKRKVRKILKILQVDALQC